MFDRVETHSDRPREDARRDGPGGGDRRMRGRIKGDRDRLGRRLARWRESNGKMQYPWIGNIGRVAIRRELVITRRYGAATVEK